MKRNIKFVERDKGKHRTAWEIWNRKYGKIIDFIEWFYGVGKNSSWRNIVGFGVYECYHIRLQKPNSGKCPFIGKYRTNKLKLCKKLDWWELVRNGDHAHSKSSVKRKSRNRRYEHHTFRQKLKRDTKKYERDDVKIKIVGLALCYELSENERSEMLDSNLRNEEMDMWIDSVRNCYVSPFTMIEDEPISYIHEISNQSLLEAISDWNIEILPRSINSDLIKYVYEFNNRKVLLDY